MHLRGLSLTHLEQHSRAELISTDLTSFAHKTPSSVMPWVVIHIMNCIFLINTSLCASSFYNKTLYLHAAHAIPVIEVYCIHRTFFLPVQVHVRFETLGMQLPLEESIYMLCIHAALTQDH